MNILLFRDLPTSALDALRSRFPSVQFRQTTQIGEVMADADWPTAVFGNIPAKIARQLPNMAWLQIVSSGIDEYAELAETEVVVTTAHGLHATIIAQHTLMMLLMLERGYPFFATAQREHSWQRRPDVPRRIEGLTLGLIGYGAIGREIARLVSPLGVRVMATKRTPPADPLPHGAEFVPWEDRKVLLSASDHLVLALPLTPDTRQVLDAAHLALLKPSAYVHNVSRGGLIDEDALLDALASNRLAGVALDTFETEPLPVASPWWTSPNAIVTPHIAGHHRELGELTLDRFSANLQRYLQRAPLDHVAHFSRGY